jgi:hypothetical protein
MVKIKDVRIAIAAGAHPRTFIIFLLAAREEQA